MGGACVAGGQSCVWGRAGPPIHWGRGGCHPEFTTLGSPPCSGQPVWSPPSGGGLYLCREERGRPLRHRAPGRRAEGAPGTGRPEGRPPCLRNLWLLSAGQQPPEVWEGSGEAGEGWGGGAYRGGAGRENVITRSSLLKVRHRLVGTEFMGGEGSRGAGAWLGPGGYRQIQSGPSSHIHHLERRRA